MEWPATKKIKSAIENEREMVETSDEKLNEGRRATASIIAYKESPLILGTHGVYPIRNESPSCDGMTVDLSDGCGSEM